MTSAFLAPHAMKRVQAVISWAQRNGLFFALVILSIYFSTVSHHFLTASNISVVLLQVSVVGIMAIPGAMLVLSGYVDLSVGSVSGLTAVVFAWLFQVHTPELLAFVLALAAGTGWGVMNGYLISYLGFSPIIVTLGGLAGARGLAEIITQGYTVFGFGPQFAFLGNGKILSLPVPVWIFAVAFLLGAYAWYQAPYGRWMTGTGADRGAARSLGIPVQRIPFILYTLSGFAAALGGLIVASQLDAGSETIGTGAELDVLTAILLGGVSFYGGRGSLFGVLWGVLFIGVLANGLVQINISPFFSQFAVGIALVFAAALDVLYQRLDRVQLAEEAEAAPPTELEEDLLQDTLLPSQGGGTHEVV
jgi:ribose/xylose/arabinose/galactoside ABC-type transport system permease subunit